MAVRLVCRYCQSTDTWAHYEHSSCVKASLGTNTYAWDQEAVGPTPDGVPQPQPCPGKDSASVAPLSAQCRKCGKTFWQATAD